MHNLWLAMALSMSLVGCILCYLSTPQQSWRANRLPASPARIAAALLWFGSFISFVLSGFSLAAALFAVCVSVMLTLGCLPFSSLWLADSAIPRSRKQLTGDGLSVGQKGNYLPIQPHWWSKSIVGCLLGFSLALAISGLWAWWGPGGIDAADKVQFNMWIVTPFWMIIFSLVYLFRTGWQALAFLAAFNGVAWTLLAIARGLANA